MALLAVHNSFANPRNIRSYEDKVNKFGNSFKTLGMITMITTTAIAITTAGLIASTLIEGSILFASSLVGFLAGIDLKTSGWNLESIGSARLLNMFSYFSKDEHTLTVTYGTIFKPF